MNLAAINQRDFACAYIDIRYTGLQPQFDVLFDVEVVTAQRDPFLWRISGQVILGQVGPVHRRRIVVAQHDDVPLETMATQHLCGSEPGGTAANDHDLAWRLARGCDTDA